MSTQAERYRIAVNKWTARIMPVVLAGIVGYATYVLVVPLCVHYLLVKHNDKGAAIPIVVIYFLLFILMTVAFLRLVYITVFDPPYVPLGPAALRNHERYNRSGNARLEENGISMGEYDPGNKSGGVSPRGAGFNNDLDSPGLELFYTKDAFVSEMDGRPVWCSQCCNWKPDRAHHDSSSGRCIRKMDHFCPWVGGPVGENNFKFFIQFNGYTALYCIYLLVVMAFYVHEQKTTEGENVNPQFCAILGLATFFGLFTAGMTGTSLDLAAKNLTQVEKLGEKTKVYILAVLKPPPEKLHQLASPGTPEPSYREITYPLEAGFQLNNRASNCVPVTPTNESPPKPQAVGNTRNAQFINEPPNLLPIETAEPQVKSSTGSPNPPEDTTRSIPLAARGPITSIQESSRPRETLSPRDLRATRTFAVLKMQRPGDNPWNLGSARLNLETVMGTSALDWVLPIRRSPCCNHESPESQFQFGPIVYLLRLSYRLLDPKDIHLPKKTRGRLERFHNEDHLDHLAQDPFLNEANALPMRNLDHDSAYPQRQEIGVELIHDRVQTHVN